MKKNALVIVLVTAIIATALVAAESDSAQVQQWINQKIPCDQLNQTQLEMVGDYYMSQILTPQPHEYMDSMMGGDNAPMDERMHLSLAYTYYCNDSANYTTSDNYAYGMGPGMMGNYPSNYGPGMMYAYGDRTPFMYYLPWILLVLVLGAGIAVTIVLVSRNKKPARKSSLKR